MVTIGNDWDGIIGDEFKRDYYLKLREFLKQEYKSYKIHPDMYDIFNALKWTGYKDTKVVILGQDPYHEEGQAHGLAFSVQKGVRIPPSLLNMYKELQDDLGCTLPDHGYLTKWAEQGVLLLNTVLTVREGLPNSHKDCGWTWFTDEVIKILNKRDTPIVFILWGGNARSKVKFIDKTKHFIIESAHPSPLSSYQGFFGSKPFSKTNELLKSANISPIDWNL